MKAGDREEQVRRGENESGNPSREWETNDFYILHPSVQQCRAALHQRNQAPERRPNRLFPTGQAMDCLLHDLG
jgi:hypothetical protein